MESITETIGCDLGDKFSQLCVLSGAGEVTERARVRTTAVAFRKWFSGRKVATVVIEVGTHSRWVQRELRVAGHQVIVANARQVRLIYGGGRKSDRLDAEKLARLGRFDTQLLKPIEHRGDDAHSKLMLLRSRDQLVRTRTELMGHVRGVLKTFGLRLVRCDSRAFGRRALEQIPPQLEASLVPVIQTIEQLTEQVQGYNRQIAQMADGCPEAQAIMSIQGVGPLTTMAFLLTLEDPRRFARSRDVGPFLGLVPSQWQSGDSNPQLRITKAGDGFVRKLLVNCAHYILGPFGPDSDLKRFGLRVMGRGGKMAKKKAVIAVTRKLAVLMHRLWVTGELYEPLSAPHTAATG